MKEEGIFMNKLFKGLLVVGMALTMVGCGNSNTSDSTKLLIGVSPDYAPYESINANNEMEGFDIDMTKELVDIMNKNGGNYEYEFKQLSFDTIATSITSDQIDLGISGFTYHEEWKGVIWSDAYNDSKQVALVAEDSDIKTVKDLEGKKIGAQLAATGEACAKDIKGAEVNAVKDVKVLVEALKSGGVDAVILDYAVAKNYDVQDAYKMIDESLLEEKNMIIAKKSNDKLMEDVNKAIKEFVNSQKYTELKEKWGA